jgi:hypothetical protein
MRLFLLDDEFGVAENKKEACQMAMRYDPNNLEGRRLPPVFDPDNPASSCHDLGHDLGEAPNWISKYIILVGEM